MDKMAFEAEVNGHKLILDEDEKVGGENRGPRPKPFVMVALAGCTAMDVISILKKMKVEVVDFKVSVDGDMTDEHPMKFTKMHIIYEFKGKKLPIKKIERAVSLSEERYCGVSATYKDSVELTSEIKLIEE